MDPEERIGLFVAGPKGRLEAARRRRDADWQELLKFGTTLGVPHFGAYAEAQHEYWFYRMVEIRSTEGKTWAKALEITRDNVWKALADPAESSDAWDRANAHSWRKAAWRFVHDTETLLWQQEGGNDGEHGDAA